MPSVGGVIVVKVSGSPSGSEHGIAIGPWNACCTVTAVFPHTGPLESRRSVTTLPTAIAYAWRPSGAIATPVGVPRPAKPEHEPATAVVWTQPRASLRAVNVPSAPRLSSTTALPTA